MRWENYPTYSENRLEDLLDKMGYKQFKKDESGEHFRKQNFHLIVRERKTRIEYNLHQDVRNIYGGHKAIKSGNHIEEEKKNIIRYLKSHLK